MKEIFFYKYGDQKVEMKLTDPSIILLLKSHKLQQSLDFEKQMDKTRPTCG